LSVLLAAGLGPDWLREYPVRLATVERDDVLAAAQTFLAPGRLVSVLLGDAAAVQHSVSALGPLVVESADGL
jgi:predicted Zn-dependent peptidase